MIKRSLALMGLATISAGGFAATFFDGFESYSTGPLVTGGWGGWDNVAANAGKVSTAQAFAGTKSINIHTSGAADFSDYTDAVHPWAGFSTGKYVVSAWQFLPAGSTTGSTPYFILMNKYDGTGVGYQWSSQVRFSGVDNKVHDDYLADANQNLPSIVYGTWTPIHVYVDLDAMFGGIERGEQRTWYNWTRLESSAWLGLGNVRTWKDTSATPTEIQNVDLFVNPEGGSPVDHYYDNLAIRENVSTVHANSVMDIDGFNIGGDLDSLQASDNNSYVAFNDDVSLLCTLEFGGNNNLPSIVAVTFNMEHSVGRPGLSYAVSMYNYATNTWVNKGGGVAPTADAVHSSVVTTGANDYSSKGAMKSRVTYAPINDEDPAQDGWPHSIDEVSWTSTAF